MNVKELRDKLKLTISALAIKLKVNSSTVFRWEHGTARPSKSAIKKLERLERKYNKEDTNIE